MIGYTHSSSKKLTYMNQSVVRKLFESDSEDGDSGSESDGDSMEIEEDGIGSACRRLDFDNEVEEEDSDSDSDSDSGSEKDSAVSGHVRLFNNEMFHSWNEKAGAIDIPVLILDNSGIERNKDVDAIPRFFSTQMRASHGRAMIPFVVTDVSGDFISLNTYLHRLDCGSGPGSSSGSPIGYRGPSATKFREILYKKPMFDEMMDFYEGVNNFLYSTFLLKQFAAVYGYVPQFYSPISDEAKYYFYIFFDYLRRKAIAGNSLFRKQSVLHLVRDLGSLEGEILTPELIVQRIRGVGQDLFDVDQFTILDSSEPFTIRV